MFQVQVLEKKNEVVCLGNNFFAVRQSFTLMFVGLCCFPEIWLQFEAIEFSEEQG